MQTYIIQALQVFFHTLLGDAAAFAHPLPYASFAHRQQQEPPCCPGKGQGNIFELGVVPCNVLFGREDSAQKNPAAAGMDIGDTLIGMHLQDVAVPVRLPYNQIGNAHVVYARTRPKFIGGERAVYDDKLK